MCQDFIARTKSDDQSNSNISSGNEKSCSRKKKHPGVQHDASMISIIKRTGGCNDKSKNYDEPSQVEFEGTFKMGRNMISDDIDKNLKVNILLLLFPLKGLI